MESCCICWESAAEGVTLDHIVEDIGVRELIALILSLEAIPGRFDSELLCAKCLEAMLECRRMKKKAEKMLVLKSYGLNPMAPEFRPSAASVPRPEDISHFYDLPDDSDSPYDADTSGSHNDTTIVGDEPALPDYDGFMSMIHETSSSFTEAREFERVDHPQPARVFTIYNFKPNNERLDSSDEGDNALNAPLLEDEAFVLPYNPNEAAFFIRFGGDENAD